MTNRFLSFRRIDASLVFYGRIWQQYKNGFNDSLDKNMWLGLDRIHVLSSRGNFGDVLLRIEIEGDRILNSTYANAYLQSKYYFSVINVKT